MHALLALVFAMGCGGATTDRADAGPGDADAGGGEGEGEGEADAGADASIWHAAVETCGDGRDDDGDGLADEDCPPSLWAGVFPPGGGAGLGVVEALETDVRRAISVVQTYRSTAAPERIGPDLGSIFAHGSVAHLNLEPSGYTRAQYLDAEDDPAIDADLHAVAAALADALEADPAGLVLFTFAAEMNGNWTDWGCLPAADFVALYRKAHDVVRAEVAERPAIDARRLRWVFGPNSVSSGGCPSAAEYWPGADAADYVGISAYRSGAATVEASVLAPSVDLLDDLTFEPSVRRDRFVVLQTGTRDVAGEADRGAWLADLYDALREDSSVLGVIYFDDSDWTLLAAGDPPVPSAGYDAWVDALAALPVADQRLEGTFDPYFWDVRLGDPRYAEVQSLRAAGVTSGCATAPPLYCPEDSLKRGDASTLLQRAFGITPEDLPPALLERPEDPIRRDELAAVLELLSGPPPDTDPAPRFDDLDGLAQDVAQAIESLARVGRVDECEPRHFCPADPATRAVGGAWIVRSAGLPAAPRP